MMRCHKVMEILYALKIHNTGNFMYDNDNHMCMRVNAGHL